MAYRHVILYYCRPTFRHALSGFAQDQMKCAPFFIFAHAEPVVGQCVFRNVFVVYYYMLYLNVDQLILRVIGGSSSCGLLVEMSSLLFIVFRLAISICSTSEISDIVGKFGPMYHIACKGWNTLLALQCCTNFWISQI